MLPLGPSRGLREVRPQAAADARPFSVAEHVECRLPPFGSMVTPPATQSLASAQQAVAPLVHAQSFGAETNLVLVHELLGVGRAQQQQLAHLDGSPLAVRLASVMCSRRMPVGPGTVKATSAATRRACTIPRRGAARWRIQLRVTVGLRAQRGGEEEFLGPEQILAFAKREEPGGDKPAVALL